MNATWGILEQTTLSAWLVLPASSSLRWGLLNALHALGASTLHRWQLHPTCAQNVLRDHTLRLIIHSAWPAHRMLGLSLLVSQLRVASAMLASLGQVEVPALRVRRENTSTPSATQTRQIVFRVPRARTRKSLVLPQRVTVSGVNGGHILPVLAQHCHQCASCVPL